MRAGVAACGLVALALTAGCGSVERQPELPPFPTERLRTEALEQADVVMPVVQRVLGGRMARAFAGPADCNSEPGMAAWIVHAYLPRSTNIDDEGRASVPGFDEDATVARLLPLLADHGYRVHERFDKVLTNGSAELFLDEDFQLAHELEPGQPRQGGVTVVLRSDCRPLAEERYGDIATDPGPETLDPSRWAR